MNTAENISAFDLIQNFLKKYIKKNDVAIYLISLIASVSVHFFMFTDKYLNHDDIAGLISNFDFAVSSGRWLLKPISLLTGTFSSAYLNGIFASVFLALAVMFMIKLFDIDRLIPATLAAVTLAAFPTIAATYTYMFCAPAYMFALAMASIGTYLVTRYKIPHMICGVVLLTLSLGCYQSYLSVAATLMVMQLGIDILRDGENNKLSRFLGHAFSALGCLALALVFYYIIMNLSLKLTGQTLGAYQDMNSLGDLTFEDWKKRFELCYDLYTPYYKGQLYNQASTNYWPIIKACIAVGIGSSVICLIKTKLYKKPLMIIALAVLSYLYPLASNLAYLMTDSRTVHMLMLYPLVFIAVVPAIAMNAIKIKANCKIWGKALAIVLAVCLIGIQGLAGREHVILTNKAYFAMDLSYETMQAYATRLTARIESTEGYHYGMPIYMYGTADVPDSHIPHTGVTGALTPDSVLATYARDSYLQMFISFPVFHASEEQEAEIIDSEILDDMPCYPDDGSIVNHDGVIVIKFSD